MPKTLARYLISEVLPPFFFGLMVFTFILLIARILKLIELVVTRGVPLLEVGKLLSMILPTFFELTVPMAFLLAILLGLGRLANDGEILALKASGISPPQILRPMSGIAVIIGLLTLGLTLFARPAANLALKKELYNIARTRVGTALKEKVFNTDFPKILIYVEEIIPPGNTAQGILIVDKRDRLKEDIILGKVALISTDERNNTLGLKLFDGSIYEKEKKRSGFSQTRFDIYDFKLNLDDLIGPANQNDTAPNEASVKRLINTIRKKEASGGQAIAERVELQERFSFAFVPLVFCLLGVSLTLLPKSSRGSRSWGFVLCLFWLLAYYALLSLGRALGNNGVLHPIPALWFPNVIVGGIGVFLFMKAVRESPFYLQKKLDAVWIWTAQSLARHRGKAQ